jgi:hypothetical protein
MTIDEELPEKVRQTIKTRKSMLTVFIDPTKFVIMNLLPHSTSFIAVYFINNMIIRLASGHTQQGMIWLVTNCIYISTTLNATLLGIAKKKCPAFNVSVFPTSRIHPLWPAQNSTGCPESPQAPFHLDALDFSQGS